MRKLLRALKWLAEHIYVKQTDLNNGEAKPHNAVEVGIKGSF